MGVLIQAQSSGLGDFLQQAVSIAVCFLVFSQVQKYIEDFYEFT